MNIQELLKSDADFTVSIGIKDLRVWHNEVIESKRKELDQSLRNGNTETYLTTNEVESMIRVDKTTLWRWAKKGYLVPVEIGGSRRYRLSDIEAILNNGKKKGA